jgi:hypothetical protein
LRTSAPDVAHLILDVISLDYHQTLMAASGAPAAVGVAVGTDVLHAGEHIPVPSAAAGLLYDASICIGCKACVAARGEANDTPPDTRGDALDQAPSDLSDLTRNAIKL